jgi:hypothetical protein
MIRPGTFVSARLEKSFRRAITALEAIRLTLAGTPLATAPWPGREHLHLLNRSRVKRGGSVR